MSPENTIKPHHPEGGSREKSLGGTEALLKCRAAKLQKQKLSWSRNDQRMLKTRKKASISTLAAKDK